MKIIRTKADLDLIDRSQSLALVPTMGALHQGHLSLVKLAREKAQKVIVSIFVNPTQFGPNEDFDNYPRPIEADIEKLEKENLDYLFLPNLDLIYPEGKKISHKANPDLANALCGLDRPGHFDGVCTVVYKLFDLIKAQYAVFGEKDFQQLLVIEDMVKAEKLDIKIVRAPILREVDGLAMSSRNIYLDAEQRKLAAEINKGLKQIQLGDLSIEELKVELEAKSFSVDYLEERWQRLFIAVKLGETRLIDNLDFR